MKKCRFGALTALVMSGSVVLAAPNMLVNLDAGDFSASSPGDPVSAWVNSGTLGGEFVPVGTGEGTTYSVVDGVPAVSLAGSKDSVMTNGVSPNALCGTAPWSFEIWVHNPVATGNEVVFSWTARGSGQGDGRLMEFRYGTDVNNAVEHYGGAYNLPWGGAIPTVNEWHHIAVTRDTNGFERLYLDGDLRYTGLRINNILRNDVGYFTLGCTPNKDNFNFNDMLFSGSIARLRIYDGFLTQEEVFSNYETERVALSLPAVPPQASLWTGTPGAWEAWNTPSKWLAGAVPPNGKPVYIANKGKAGGFAGTNTFPELFAIDGGFGMTDGLLTVANPPNGVSMGQGAGYVFDFDLKGGKFHIADGANTHLYLGRDGSAGYATIGGGTELAWLCVDGAVQVAKSTTGYGYMEVLANGLVTTSNNTMYVTAEGGTGTVVVAGGEIRGERLTTFNHGHGAGAQAKLIVDDGLVGQFGDFTMSQNGQNASNLAELFLNGGVVWVSRVFGNKPATNIVYLNGGTFRNRDSRTGGNLDNGFFANQNNNDPGGLTAYVQAGGAKFEVLFNTTIDINLPLIEDPSSPGGGLTKTGEGSLQLRGANTFTGDIVVKEGHLNLRTAQALPPGVKRILLEAPGGMGLDVAGGAATLLALIDPASTGALMLYDSNRNESLDFSGHPYLSFGTAIGNNPYTGTFTPHNNVYRFTASSGLSHYDALIADPVSGRSSVILDASSVRTAKIILRSENTYTGGTTINGGVLEMQRANALGFPSAPGVRDIGIYNGAALKFDANVNASIALGIIARIKTDSYGVILITGNNNTANYDLSQLPGISLSSENGTEYEPSLMTPYTSTTYRFGGGPGNARSDGLKPKNMTDDGETLRNLVIDFPGNPVRLHTNNTFTGGIIVTNGGALSTRDSTAMGGPLASPRADYVYIDNGFLRPNTDGVDIPYSFSLPDHGLWVGDGGMTVCVPDNRAWAWLGDLSGTGAITNGMQDDGGLIMFGGANNTWTGTLSIQNANRNDETTFAVGFGNNFSWVKTNVIQGNCLFGVATDLDITWSDKFERPLGNTPISFDAPDGTSASIGLRKLGAGTLTLDVPNTYRRMTKVDSGTLKVGTANAIPWGGNKGNLHVVNGNIFPRGVLDLNGFDVNVNGFNGSGVITNSAGGVKTLIVGNNNQGGTFYGTVDPSVKVTKVGNSSAQNFWKGANLGDLTTERGPLNAGAETSFGTVSLKTISTTENTGFNVGLNAAHIYGLTGEYYWFDLDGMRSRIATTPLLDLDAFDALLAPYAPTHVESSFSFGAGFDAGSNGARFQGGFHNRANHYGRWTGEFYAEADGDYVFATASDDGSAVFINRQPAITNSFSQGYSGSKRSGEPMYLTQGWHDIAVLHHQGTGDRGLTVFMTPPEGEEDVLPQRLLRPYPVTVSSLSGISGSKVELFPNTALVATGETTGIFTGRLVAASADTRLIKKGAGTLAFSGQSQPEFNGQVTISEGTLELRGATPFMHPVTIEEGAVLAALPFNEDLSAQGLIGTYYAGNYTGGATSYATLDTHFGPLEPLYVASTMQTGLLAVAESPTFWYDPRTLFPGPYSYQGADIPYFRIRFQGRFLALEPGDYTFGAISDDRMELFIDGAMVLLRTGASRTEQLTTVYLDAGSHDFQAILGQNTGDHYIGIRVAEPGDALKRMPNALLRPGGSTIYGWEGGGTLALPNPGSFLRVEITDEQTLDHGIPAAAGAGFEKNGAGTLTLMADNDSFYGEWYVMQGTMVVGDGGVAGSLGAATRLHVAEGARLVFDRSDDIVFTGLITGKGEICSVGGRVTLCDIGDGFKGIFTSGDFVITGASDVLAESFAQGPDPMNIRLEDGVKLRLQPLSETTLPLVPLVSTNVMIALQYGTTNAYYIDSLMVAAGGNVQVAGGGVSGLIGWYYDLNPFSQDAVNASFLNLVTAETYLKERPFICWASSWEVGETFDFADNGSLFPPFPNGRNKEYFGAIWKGKIRITEPGDYGFRTRSDDGSVLFINGELVVDNRGSHGMQDRPDPATFITLSAGLHDFAIVYQQGGGGYGLRVSVRFPNESNYVYLPNNMLVADPADFADMTQPEIEYVAQLAGGNLAFTLEVGTLGVVDGPGTGTVDITGNGENTNATLLLNDLFIEAPGAVLATVGKTLVSGGNLHVIMGVEPKPSSRTLVADFTGTPTFGLPLLNKTMSLQGVPNGGRLDYKNGLLYVLKPGGTVLILR